MRVEVAVPSYRRPGAFVAKTGRLLADRWGPPDSVTVFVASDVERDVYRQAIRDAGLPPYRLVVAVPGMGAVRNFITDYYAAGTRVLNLDDDLDNVLRYVDPKTLVDVTDLCEVAAEGFAAARAAGCRLWGIYPVPNPYFMKPRVATGLRYIEGAFWGTTVGRDTAAYVTLDDKEDYERSILCYLADGNVARLDTVTMRTRYYTEPGGMQEDRTEDRVTHSAHHLAARFPMLATINDSKKSGHTELRLRDRRPKR